VHVTAGTAAELLETVADAGRPGAAPGHALTAPDGHQASTGAGAAEMLTSAELCTLLCISRTTLIVWRRSGLIPFLRTGNGVRFRRSDLPWLPPPGCTLITAAAVAAMTGVGQSSVGRYRQAGLLRYVRLPGGGYRYYAGDIDCHLAAEPGHHAR
jgi:excisionase family DNA binding protein